MFWEPTNFLIGIQIENWFSPLAGIMETIASSVELVW